jgi:hypothetical protein
MYDNNLTLLLDEFKKWTPCFAVMFGDVDSIHGGSNRHLAWGDEKKKGKNGNDCRTKCYKQYDQKQCQAGSKLRG